MKRALSFKGSLTRGFNQKKKKNSTTIKAITFNHYSYPCLEIPFVEFSLYFFSSCLYVDSNGAR